MKRCPKCKTDYFDNMLEFCLEDGAKLVSVSDAKTETKTVTHAASANPSTAQTVNLPFSTAATPLAKKETAENDQPVLTATKKIETSVKNTGIETLTIAPVVVALAHNWLQWVYLDNRSYGSISEFLISPDFLFWLFLLILGAITGLSAIKYCKRKGFAYLSLIVLAVNLILLLVPRR